VVDIEMIVFQGRPFLDGRQGSINFTLEEIKLPLILDYEAFDKPITRGSADYKLRVRQEEKTESTLINRLS